MNVAVLGGAGYAAGELLRLLLQHPKVTGLLVTSRSHAGKSIAEVVWVVRWSSPGSP